MGINASPCLVVTDVIRVALCVSMTGRECRKDDESRAAGASDMPLSREESSERPS
jgi:hypothetical protein